MDKFINKLKKGAYAVTDKAQQTLEVTRLNAIILTKNRDLKNLYQRIGEIFYSGYRQQDAAPAKEDLLTYCHKIDRVKAEITELEMKINELKNLKSCACGKAVPVEATVCPNCGIAFETKIVHEHDTDEQHKPPKLT